MDEAGADGMSADGEAESRAGRFCAEGDSEGTATGKDESTGAAFAGAERVGDGVDAAATGAGAADSLGTEALFSVFFASAHATEQ